MFDSIVIRNQRKISSKTPIDMDAFYEALLFYKRVTLIADKAMLSQLVLTCGHDFVLELVSDGFLQIEYLNSNTAIHTQNSGSANELHSPILFSSPVLDLDNVAFEIFQKSTGKSGKGRRFANKFLQKVTVADFGDELIKNLTEDLADSDYVEKSVKYILENYTPEYPDISKLNFLVNETQGELSVDTNIDFIRLNKIYHTRISPEHSSLTPAYLLSHLFNTRGDIHFSSTHNSNISTDLVSSGIMEFKYSDLLQRQGVSFDKLNSFQNFVDVDTKKVRGVLESRNRSYDDFLVLLKKAGKMKSWLDSKDLDVNLIKEYHKAVIADSWVDKLPTKITRWTIFNGLGLVFGGVAGLGISALDNFFIEKIIRGWKPSHFIAELNEFIDS